MIKTKYYIRLSIIKLFTEVKPVKLFVQIIIYNNIQIRFLEAHLLPNYYQFKARSSNYARPSFIHLVPLYRALLNINSMDKYFLYLNHCFKLISIDKLQFQAAMSRVLENVFVDFFLALLTVGLTLLN